MAKDDKAAGRPRPSPTIDLKATEISSAPAVDAKKDQPKESGKAAEAPRAEASRPEAAPPPPDMGSGQRRTASWLMPAAIAAGAGLPLFLLGWWLGDYASGGVRVAAPTPVPPEIIARLDKIEAALAQPPAADAAVRGVADNLAALNRRVDDIALAAREARTRADTAAESAQKSAQTSSGIRPAELDTLSKRIAALEQATTSKDSDLADRISGEAEDQAGRRAVVASALQNAVERGDPYADELAAAKVLAADAAALSPLDRFTSEGIPSTRALARELSVIAQAMAKTVGEPVRQGGVLEKLQASAERLVRIRPVGDIPGDDPAAIVSRIELKAARSDIAGALQELAKLPPQVRAPAEPWIKKAQAREAALAASRQFARDAIATLGKPEL